MLGFDFNRLERPLRVLLLGAHCDDIEIGCGATLLRLARRYPDAEFHWHTFASDEERAEETKRCASSLLSEAGALSIEIDTFRESYFPSQLPEIKERMEEIKGRSTPDVVFTHFREDRHQDHQILSDATWNTFRDHAILEYEIPKFDGDLGLPNVFVPIDRATVDRKVSALMECFKSQTGRYWFTPETFTSLMRIRGVESRSDTGYAEAFFARKMSLPL